MELNFRETEFFTECYRRIDMTATVSASIKSSWHRRADKTLYTAFGIVGLHFFDVYLYQQFHFLLRSYFCLNSKVKYN